MPAPFIFDTAAGFLQGNPSNSQYMLNWGTLTPDQQSKMFNLLETYNSDNVNNPISIDANGNIDFSRFMVGNNGFDWGSALDFGKLGLQALGLGAGIWGGRQQMKLARQQLDAAREAFEWNKRAQTTNFNNTVAAQNDAITARNRAAAMQNTGATGSEADAIANTYHRPDLKTL